MRNFLVTLYYLTSFAKKQMLAFISLIQILLCEFVHNLHTYQQHEKLLGFNFFSNEIDLFHRLHASLRCICHNPLKIDNLDRINSQCYSLWAMGKVCLSSLFTEKDRSYFLTYYTDDESRRQLIDVLVTATTSCAFCVRKFYSTDKKQQTIGSSIEENDCLEEARSSKMCNQKINEAFFETVNERDFFLFAGANFATQKGQNL